MAYKTLAARVKFQGPNPVVELNEMMEVEVLKMCRSCSAYEYDGGWHFDEPAFLKGKEPNEEVYVQFSKCPTCYTKDIFSRIRSLLK